MINFIFAYFLSGVVLSFFFIRFFRRYFDASLLWLLGFSLSPLIISIILFYLFLLFPKEESFFYLSFIYAIFIGIFFISTPWKNVRQEKFSQFYVFLKNKVKSYNFFKLPDIKILILSTFILFVFSFVFIKGFIYPVTWPDLSAYIKQGYIYSKVHSLPDINSKKVYSFCEESACYKINKAIRPALPLFQTFFSLPSPILKTYYNHHFFESRFIYFYYFFLSLISFYYIFLNLNKKSFLALVGITIALSTYGLTHFLIYNFKEIIYIHFILVSLYLIYLYNQSSLEEKTKKKAIIVFLGTFIGLGIYLNYNGILIGVILITIVFFFNRKRLSISQKTISAIIIILLIVFFSGSELYKGTTQFILKRGLISTENRVGTFKAKTSEVVGHKILEDKDEVESRPKEAMLNILIKSKLQAFTQIFLYGFTFYLFYLTLILYISSKANRNNFSNLLLAFIIPYHFIISDPLFLNPHHYAYVLSMSQKYTILLIPLVSFFIALNINVWNDVLIKLKNFITNNIDSLWILLFSLIAIMIGINEYWRTEIAKIIFNVLNIIAPLHNEKSYYFERLDNFLWGFLILVGIFILIVFFITKREIFPPTKHNTRFIMVIVAFIIPYICLLNSNHPIIATYFHLKSSKLKKITAVSPTIQEKNFYKTIEYINRKLPENATIFVIAHGNYGPNTRKAKMYINNENRIIRKETSALLKTNPNESEYVLTHRLLKNTFGKEWQTVFKNDHYIILKNPKPIKKK